MGGGMCRGVCGSGCSGRSRSVHVGEGEGMSFAVFLRFFGCLLLVLSKDVSYAKSGWCHACENGLLCIVMSITCAL